MPEKRNLTPTEVVRVLFQSVAENGRMPIKAVAVSDGEEALLKDAGGGLVNPRSEKARLHDFP